MKPFISLMLSKSVYLLCILSFSIGAQPLKLESDVEQPIQQPGFDWSTLNKIWDDDIQFHGFFSQALFSTTGNNVYGKSIDTVNAGLTELGLNISYQALNKLSFAAQGLYRRAGKNTGAGGQVSLDYAFFDYTLFNFNNGRIGIRGGRVKNPWGFYNETRDVASTHPTISLPFAYFDRSRSLLLSLDGGQVYADYNTAVGDFSFKLNYGLVNADDDELLLAITLNPNIAGHLQGDLSLVSQLSYDILGGQYAFAVSYAHINFSYVAGNDFDPFTGLKGAFDSFMLSAQYNGEKFSLGAEFNMTWNNFSGIANSPARTPISQYWYVQAGYRIIDNLQATIRYDYATRDINDRTGQDFHDRTGLPAQMIFAQAAVVGLRWDITPTWMVRAEYSRVHGAATVSLLDNPVLSELALNWNIYSLQIAYRF